MLIRVQQGKGKKDRYTLLSQMTLEQLTGLDPDVCPFCKQKTLQLLGHIVQQYLPIGRAAPVSIQIITTKGELIPLSV